MKFFLGLSVGIAVGAFGFMYIKIDAIHHNILEIYKTLEFLNPTEEHEQGCTCPSEN